MTVSDPLLWLLLAPTLAYSMGIAIIAMWRARAGQHAAPPVSDDALPAIAVLVAARNEEDNIERCLDALLAQDYPRDRITIYVADDHSTDRTPQILARYDRTTEGPVVRIIEVPEATERLRGKALAIHTAIEQSSEGLLLMTDADCAPPPAWARTMVAYFADENVGVLTAATTVDSRHAERRLLAEVQALDWRYLLSASAFMVETGRPITAMGNNMGFRRSAYDAVGGYPALPFSVTEDYLLFRRIVDRTAFSARFPVDPGVLNVTIPLPRLRDVFSQRRRWARGGMRAPLIAYGIYTLTHLAHIIPIVLLFIATLPAALALLIKTVADLALLSIATPANSSGELRAFPLWASYFLGYMCVLPATVVLFPRIRWKGRRL